MVSIGMISQSVGEIIHLVRNQNGTFDLGSPDAKSGQRNKYHHMVLHELGYFQGERCDRIASGWA